MTRALDLFLAGLLVAVCSPLLLVAVVAIRLESSGPAFYRQRRVGRAGRPFELWKLRTMVAGAEETGAGIYVLEGDPRITRVGRILRRLSLDELPQLWNVLRGEMSLVGPRPLVAEEDRLIEGWHRERLSLTPGMTGHWQVLGSARIPLQEMVKLDYTYVQNWSAWNDVKLLLRTISLLATRRGV